MTVITVLGSGIMATALAVPLADNGHEVRLVGTHLDRDIIDSIQNSRVHPNLGLEVPETASAHQLEDAAAAFEGADVILSGVNSFGVEWAAEQLAGLLQPGMHVIAIAKGLHAEEDGTLRILPDVLASRTDPQLREQVSWSAIVGPSIAGEVAVRRDTCVLFAGSDQAVLDELAALFRTDRYHIWTSQDMIGAEVAAAMKNCYSLAVGMGRGVLEARGEDGGPYNNHNFEAALFGQGYLEIQRMTEFLGGEAHTTLNALPSAGDMYVTSQGGRNVRVGRLLGAGYKFSDASEELGNPTLEGAAAIRVVGAALPKLTERGEIAEDDFPLLRHLYDVIGLEQPLDIPWSSFYGGEPVGAT